MCVPTFWIDARECHSHKHTYMHMLGCLSAWMVGLISSGTSLSISKCWLLHGDFLVHLRKSQVISGQHGIILTPKVINIAQCFSLWKNFAAETSHVHCFGWTTPPFLRVMSFYSRLPSTPFPFMPPIVPCFWPWSPMIPMIKKPYIPTINVAGVAWNFWASWLVAGQNENPTFVMGALDKSHPKSWISISNVHSCRCFGCVQNPPGLSDDCPDARYSLTGRTAMSEEMYLDVLGGSFSCCARISLAAFVGSTMFFHVETGKHRCFDAELLMKQDCTIWKVRFFFGCFAWSTNVGEPVEMGGQRFCAWFWPRKASRWYAVWPSEDPICELASLVKLYRRCRWSFFSIVHVIIILFILIDQQAGQIPNSKRFIYPLATSWRTKRKPQGVFGAEKWTAGRRRPRQHRFVCVGNFQVIQICNQQIRSPQHHMTSCCIKPGHARASQHITTFVSPFCRISKRFLPLQVSFEKVSHEMRFERSGHETFTLHFWSFAGCLYFHVFLRGRL